MKSYSKLLSVVAVAAVLASCDKKDELNVAPAGTAPKLEASTTTVAPAASDSLSTVLTLRWSDPTYSSTTMTKYVVQIDSIGKNFSNPLTRVVNGGNITGFTAKQLTEWMLYTRDWEPGVTTTLQMRVLSSYANNNEQLASNVITFTAKPYTPPFAVALPASGELYITGGDFGWNNSAVMPNQKLTKVGAAKFSRTFTLQGGQSFLLLPVAGDWGDKYGGVGANNNSNNPIHDGFKRGGSDLRTPLGAGTYTLTVNFLTGQYQWVKVS